MNKRNLSQWLDYISATHPSEIEMGLERVRKVYSRLSLTLRGTKVVLVAGTNGKGSTIAMIESALSALGYQVGAYTSPHILEYNERVRINGTPVEDAPLVSSFERVENARAAIPLTYFEFGTLAALDLLASAELDVILLEIGLGGRLDAVNIVEPDLSIITSIGLDHTDWLGNTLDQIGLEKAGILRNGVTFVAGEDMPKSVLEKSVELNCKRFLCRENFDNDKTQGVYLTYAGARHFFEGFPQVRLPENNILLALQATLCLYNDMSDRAGQFDQAVFNIVVKSIEQVCIPGRLELIPVNAEVYIDVGHNAHAAVYLKAFLMHHAQQNKSIQLIYSSLKDKDVSAIAEILAPCADRWLLAPLDCERAMSVEELSASVKMYASDNVSCFDSVADAIRAGIGYAEQAQKNNRTVLTLIFGSFYMVEAAKRFFKSYE